MQSFEGLQWDELDFLEFFEVVPEEDDFFMSYAYDVLRGGFRLALTAYPIESLVAITLWPEQSEPPLIELVFYVLGEARRIRDKRGEFLEFTNIVLLPGFSAVSDDRWKRERPAVGVTLELRLKPSICLRFV